MIETRFGDIAKQSALRRVGAGLKQDVARLSQELASGRVADKPRHLGGDLARLAGLSLAQEKTLVHKRTAEGASLILDAQQTVTDDLNQLSQRRFQEIIMLEQSGSASSLPVVIETMTQGFSEIVGKLNISIAGRSILSGAASDGPALAKADQLLDSIIASLPSGASASDLVAHVEDWFSAGGSFDTLGYLGAPPVPARLDLGQGVTTSLDVTAQDPAFRTTLAAFAMGALLSRGIFTGDQGSQKAVLASAGQRLAASSAALTDLSARLGVEEAKLARATTRAVSEHTAISIALSSLREADPYATATRLEQTMVQLDLVYTLTARLSRLSLVEYLR